MKIISQIETTVALISLDENGIVHVHYKSYALYDVAQQLENKEAIYQLVGTRATPFLITSGENVIFTKSARENALKIEPTSPVCASAIVIENLAYRLVAEFYIKIQKPKKPHKIFTNREKAYEWCKQFLTIKENQ
ncbi:MAG: hypothetical protein ABI315_01110 [Bacteroidia bacterium]